MPQKAAHGKRAGYGATADAVVGVCHELARMGFVAATDGNVSARLANGNFLITRTGLNKALVKKTDLVEVGPDGKPVGSRKVMSTELGMHLFIYRERPDIGAVVHAHPVCATGFAAARVALDACLLPEVIAGLGVVPLAEYATPSTEEVARSLSPFVKKAEAILLANHGVVTYGRDPYEAYARMEKVEQSARITLVARILGGGISLTPEEVGRLRDAIHAVSGTWAAERLPFRNNAKNH